MSMLGRRGLLKSFGLLPLAGKSKHKKEPDPVGWNGQNVFAQVVIVYGSGVTGYFQYSGQPALGNPPIAWAVPPGVTKDPVGNTLPVSGGFAVAGASGSIAQLATGFVAVRNGAEHAGGSLGETAPGNTELVSGLVTAGDTPAVVTLVSKAADFSGAAQVVVSNTTSPLPSTSAMLEVLGDVALTELSAAPPTPAGAGRLYVDATGHLHYLGPGGTNTIIANP